MPSINTNAGSLPIQSSAYLQTLHPLGRTPFNSGRTTCLRISVILTTSPVLWRVDHLTIANINTRMVAV